GVGGRTASNSREMGVDAVTKLVPRRSVATFCSEPSDRTSQLVSSATRTRSNLRARRGLGRQSGQGVRHGPLHRGLQETRNLSFDWSVLSPSGTQAIAASAIDRPSVRRRGFLAEN